MEHYVLKLYKVYINDDPELTLTYFTTMSNLAKIVFGTYSRPRYPLSPIGRIKILMFEEYGHAQTVPRYQVSVYTGFLFVFFVGCLLGKGHVLGFPLMSMCLYPIPIRYVIGRLYKSSSFCFLYTRYPC